MSWVFWNYGNFSGFVFSDKSEFRRCTVGWFFLWCLFLGSTFSWEFFNCDFQILSDQLCCGVDDIASIELNICDTQPSCLGGGNNEFIFSGRLDNLASSYCALRALIDSCESPGNLSSEHAIRIIALFDNEEVKLFATFVIFFSRLRMGIALFLLHLTVITFIDTLNALGFYWFI